MKNSKASKEWHAPNTKIGSGDYYGTGIKNPIGRMRDSYMNKPMTDSKMGKPPKTLA